MKSDDSAIMTCLGAIVWVVFISLVAIFLNAWALTTMWGWIMVPTFHLPVLLYWQAWGVMAIVGYMLPTTSVDTNAKTKSWGEIIAIGLANAVGKPVLSVLLTWLVLRAFGAM